MAELDNIPQKQSVELEIVKIDSDVLETIKKLNQEINTYLLDFGQIYIRRKEISEEMVRLDEILEKSEDAFKLVNNQLREVMDGLDDKYPQGRLNIQDGTVTYQPGAPSRKQIAEEQRKRAEQGN
jgi:division protein CdvB (Snf7/Vps24/ESCRT-III family)